KFLLGSRRLVVRINRYAQPVVPILSRSRDELRGSLPLLLRRLQRPIILRHRAKASERSQPSRGYRHRSDDSHDCSSHRRCLFRCTPHSGSCAPPIPSIVGTIPHFPLSWRLALPLIEAALSSGLQCACRKKQIPLDTSISTCKLPPACSPLPNRSRSNGEPKRISANRGCRAGVADFGARPFARDCGIGPR